MVTLERFQAGKIHNKDVKDNDYILHLDIKPSNIFLGYEELHESGLLTGGLKNGIYPSIKLGDFGLAVHTSRKNSSNPASIRHIGTYYFQSPVSGSIAGRELF